jgi:hypothetical protein
MSLTSKCLQSLNLIKPEFYIFVLHSYLYSKSRNTEPSTSHLMPGVNYFSQRGKYFREFSVL